MNLIYEKNVVRSNWANVLLADGYGCAGGYPKFIDNTFIKDTTVVSNPTYHTVRSAYSSRNSTGIFISNFTENGASMDDVDLEWEYENVQNGKALKDIRIGWHLTIKVVDANNQPVNNASVSLKDSTGTTVFTGTTNSSGTITTTTEAIQFIRANQKYSGYVDAPGGGYIIERTPHSVTASSSGRSGTINGINLTRDQTVTVTIR